MYKGPFGIKKNADVIVVKLVTAIQENIYEQTHKNLQK